MGRRVRIPSMRAMSSDEDDLNGVVVGYDAATTFYRVEMDSGVVRRSVLFRQIVVPFQLREGCLC